jgi:hypothetical protein
MTLNKRKNDMFVVNVETKTMPNPTCCSDPNTMCVNCARTILNAKPDYSGQGTPPAAKADVLPVPGMYDDPIYGGKPETEAIEEKKEITTNKAIGVGAPLLPHSEF